MKIFYDPKANALDIIFRKGKSFKTKKVGKEIYLDVDKKGEPLSIEILGVNERLMANDFKNLSLTIANYPSEFGAPKVVASR